MTNSCGHKKRTCKTGPKEKGVVKRESPTLCLLLEYPDMQEVNLFLEIFFHQPFKKALTCFIMIYG
jgi:hypothetical protein